MCCSESPLQSEDPDTTQLNQIFYLMCSIKVKVCNLIINNGSYQNIVSKTLVLKLDTELHPHPYDIGWIKQGSRIKVRDLCQVLYPLANAIKIPSFLMSSTWTSAIFFWEDHGNTTLMLPIEEERTIYMLTWKGKRVVIRSIPPTTRSTKKMVPSPVSRHNQSDGTRGRIFLKREGVM